MYLTVDSLIDTNNIIIGSSNITLRKFNVKPYGCDKMYMNKDLIEGNLYKLIQINSMKEKPIIGIFILYYYTSIL